MPSFEISRGDATYRVDVGDDFLQLPEERQQSILAAALGGEPSARAAPTQPAAPDTSIAGALRHSAHNLTSGLGATGRVIGNALGNETARDVGTWLDNAVPADPSYQPATPEVIEGVRNLDAGRTFGNLPRAAVEQAGNLLGVLGAGAVAGLPGAVAMSAAQSFGQNVEARATNNNHEAPTTSDLVIGGLTTAGTAGIDALTSGVGGRTFREALPAFLPGARRAATTALPSTPSVVGRAARTARIAAGEAAGEAAQDAIEQLGQEAGTERGYSPDIAQSAGAGLIGGGSRLALSSPGLVTGSALDATRNAVSRVAASDLTEDQLRSVARVNQLLDDEYATATRRNGSDVPLEDVLKTARESVHNSLLAQLSELERRGYFSNGDDVATRRELRQVIESAFRQNKALNEGEPRVNSNGDEELPTLRVERGLRLIDENLANLPDQARRNLKDALRDLDLISQAGQKQNRTGPLAAIGARVGQAAGLAGSMYAAGTGNLPAAAIGLASSLGGTNLAARLGSTVGSYGDRFIGAHQPPPVMLRAGVNARLRRMGIDESASTTDLLKNNWSILTNEQEMRRAALRMSEKEDAQAAEARDDVAALARRKRQREEDRAWRANGWTPAGGRDAGEAGMDVLARLQARDEAARRLQESKAWAQNARASARTDADTTAKEIVQGLSEFDRRRAALRVAQQAQAAAQARTAQQGEEDLRAASQRDTRTRAQQIEAAYRERDQQRAQEPEAPRELTQDEKDAQLLSSLPQQDETEAEISAYLLAQTEARLRANQRAREMVQRTVPPKGTMPAEEPAETSPDPTEAAPVARAKAKIRTSAAKKSKKTPPPEKIEEAQAPTELPDRPSRPQGDEEPLQVPIQGPMRGWRSYVQDGVVSRGGRADARDIERAVRGLIVDGHLSVDEAAALLTNHGSVPDADLLGRIQSYIARDQGFDLSSRPRGAIQAGQGADYYAGIHSPARWDGAARNNQAAYDRARQVFEQSGDWDVVELVNRMAAKGDKEFPHPARRAALNAVLAAHPDVTERARIRAYLNPLIRDED